MHFYVYQQPRAHIHVVLFKFLLVGLHAFMYSMIIAQSPVCDLYEAVPLRIARLAVSADNHAIDMCEVHKVVLLLKPFLTLHTDEHAHAFDLHQDGVLQGRVSAGDIPHLLWLADNIGLHGVRYVCIQQATKSLEELQALEGFELLPMHIQVKDESL